MNQLINKQKRTIILLLLPIFLGGCSGFQKAVKREGEPRFIDYYFTDKYGKKITQQVSPKKKFIYLVVITENAIGEGVTLTMNEKSETDFIYNGTYISDKIHFKIKNNKQKLKLDIYNRKKRYHRYLKEKSMKSKKGKMDWIYTPFLRLADYLKL